MNGEQEKAQKEQAAEFNKQRAGGGGAGEGAEHPTNYETGGSKDDGGTGGTGDAEEENEGGGGGKDKEQEEAELPKELFPEGKSEEDYEPDNYNPKSDFPAGDATKGMPDYGQWNRGVQQFIPMRDYRAYLVSQAVKNERANDELQAEFIKGFKSQDKVAGILLNPDFMRDTSIEMVKSMMPDPLRSKEYIENFKKQRAKEMKQKEQAQQALAGAAKQTAGAGSGNGDDEE